MKILNNILLTLPITAVSALFLLHGQPLAARAGFISLIVFLYINFLFFMMLHTGKTWKYRALLFIPAALLFPIEFIYTNILERGSMLVSLSTIYECKVPFCHLVLPSLIIPVVMIKEIPFPGSMSEGHASIAEMLVLIFCAVLVVGRGWCAWGCFYGGWDEAFSLIRKKASFTFTHKLWRYLPWAVLISSSLIASCTLTPIYCQWLCPFKPVTEFKMVSTTIDIIAAVVFFSMFLIFIIILPLLSKKRAQCSFFCPLGPTLIALTNRVNLFTVSIDKDKCIQCKKCIKTCPLNAIDEESLAAGRVRTECAKCGKCLDNCPKQAISYAVRMTEGCANAGFSRLLYLYASYILMSAVLGGILAKSLQVIAKLVLG
jgi:ferredoxin-type protein NapH